ncbi:class I SAM-dependent RNA methyltransferase [Psychrilyobacter sp.]|uniref:THUMP domain-containing class I SAM-dependent RNA methyltransferase n=1 Tax=Psychrilyobacter sp. TaxID=2586924 RepID=UPI00301AD0FD
MTYTLIATSTMGVESILAQEIKDLGFKNVVTHNGRVEFDGGIEDIIKGNIWLRTADRVYLKMGEFKAFTWDEYFEKVKEIDWMSVLPINAEFPISWVSSVKCKLFSKSDMQRMAKKAIVEKLKIQYQHDYFSEEGALYRVKIIGNKDTFVMMIDTSGTPLHKRGYRAHLNEAPMKETLAAALVKLSKWNGGDRPLVDPMCGTGTILIEAAMIARNIAPGVNRRFASEDWNIIDGQLWLDARDEAFTHEDYEKEVRIYGSDLNAETIEIAIENAKLAGVENDILFETKHLLEFESMAEYGSLITNPPYGERLFDLDQVEKLYRTLGDICRMRCKKWSYYIITSHDGFEKLFDKRADKNRKLYNGNLKCRYYQYYGQRPPRLHKD